MKPNTGLQTDIGKNKIWFLAGLLAVLVMGIPYLLLGEDAVFVYHDQLDGELIAYLLQAKHLFQGGTLPEFMGGMSKASLTMPAPACVLLFLVGSPFAALVLMQLAGSLCGYVGMFLLVRKGTDKDWCGAFTGVLYAYLSFLPVYGLSQYGLPLLIWCLWELQGGKHRRTAWIYAILYALNSSLALVGFAVLGCMFLWCIGVFRQRKEVFLLWITMLVVYAAENGRLVGQLLGGGFLSHKAEYTLQATDFASGFWQAFVYGGQHSGDFRRYFLPALGVVLLLCLLKRSKQLVLLLCANTGLSVIAAMWDTAAGITLRSHLTVLGAFQLDRFLWLSPCLWYVALGLGASIVVDELQERKGIQKWLTAAVGGFLAISVGITGIQILRESTLKSNVQKLRNPDYNMLSFRDYYAIGVLDQVEDFIYDTTGMEQEEYRVVSLGIDPAAALYHGFYCLDGYSNNYELTYKHQFRRILAPELDKSDYLTDYYDHWGNRCYLLSAEAPGYYTIEKGGFYFQQYEIDTQALKELGGRYLLSAAYIQNAEEQGLMLLQEDGFETEDSYYRIYLYAVE